VLPAQAALTFELSDTVRLAPDSTHPLGAAHGGLAHADPAGELAITGRAHTSKNRPGTLTKEQDDGGIPP
jgi:hypothetical protein